MRSFWLVQRLASQNPVNPDRGFDGHFALEYMGSAEFEFSTPNDSLKSMRSRKLRIFPVTIDDKTVFFVTERKVLDAKLDEFRDWVKADPYRRSKERTCFNEALAGTLEPFERTDAWWSFDDDMAWTLDAELAKLLLTAFETKRKQ